MTIHYFPPNPEKIGDNLLTAELALDVACAGWRGVHETVVYYATPVVVRVLSAFDLPGIRMAEVADVGRSATLAHSLRAMGEPVVDLQQLNCWVDYPELRLLFDAELPERARRDWFDPSALSRWPLEPFAEIFRSMLGIPSTGAALVPRTGNGRTGPAGGSGCEVLLFPHCATTSQQLNGWERIARAIVRCVQTDEGVRKRQEVTVVGTQDAARLCDWPASVRVVTDSDGVDLPAFIAQATVCVGGATGLTHLAGALRRPALGLWRIDDRAVFAPRPGWTVRTHLAPAIDDAVTELCTAFVTEALASQEAR